MSDRIILDSMVFQGTHGVYADEQQTPQPFEVDVELRLNLQPAGLSDDLEQTVDYSRVFDTCRQIVESTRFNLIEALAEAIAHEILSGFPADEVTIRVRKPKVRLGGTCGPRQWRSGAAASPDGAGTTDAVRQRGRAARARTARRFARLADARPPRAAASRLAGRVPRTTLDLDRCSRRGGRPGSPCCPARTAPASRRAGAPGRSSGR